MKIKTNSWHYKIVSKSDNQLPKNLITYGMVLFITITFTAIAIAFLLSLLAGMPYVIYVFLYTPEMNSIQALFFLLGTFAWIAVTAYTFSHIVVCAMPFFEGLFKARKKEKKEKSWLAVEYIDEYIDNDANNEIK